MVLGEVFLEGLDDRAHLPHEDARIPVKLTGLQEHPRQFDVGLLGEALDLADGLVVRDLDVAVTRVGTRGFDAHGHQHLVLIGGKQIPGQVGKPQEQQRHQHRIQQRVGRIGHAGGRVAAHGFAEHLFFADFRDVFENQAFVFIVGHHEEILRRNHFCEAFVGVADEGFARPENVEELLGHRLPALGPEARPDAARHDDTIFIA